MKTNAFRERFDFSKIPATIQIPNLIEVQKRSYDRFLQMDKLPSEREDGGLQAVFQSVFPITDFRNVSPLARTADPRLLPTRSIPAKCFAASAAPTTRIRLTSATSAAIRLDCN